MLKHRPAPQRATSDWGSAAVVFLTIAILVAMLRAWVISPYHVPSGSMIPTIEPGQVILAEKVDTSVHRGDIVVFHDDNRWTANDPYLVKRVIGVGGDVVSARKNVLYVNGVKVWEPYVVGTTANFSVVVPAGKFFMAGDNRSYSADSRCHLNADAPDAAFISQSSIVGKVVTIGTRLVHNEGNLADIPVNKEQPPFDMSGHCGEN